MTTGQWEILAVPDLVQLGLTDALPYNFAAGGLGYLFNRSWKVTLIGLQGPRVYNSLRTTFEVEKTSFSTSNKAKVTMYNLNDFTRSFYGKGAKLSLAVGYAGLTIPLFLNADIVRVAQERKGPDILTTYEIGEGERSLTDNIINVSVPAGTSTTVVIAQLIAAMNLVQGSTVGLVPKVYNKGVVLSGVCRKVLDQILGPKFEWSVQYGTVVQIAAKGVPTKPLPVVVSMQTGLIGSPNMGSGLGGDNVLTFNHLIDPRLIPGAAIQIISRFISGTAIISKATFEGDTHESKWSVKCECTPIVLTGVNVVGAQQ